MHNDINYTDRQYTEVMEAQAFLYGTLCQQLARTGARFAVFGSDTQPHKYQIEGADGNVLGWFDDDFEMVKFLESLPDQMLDFTGEVVS
jgi:hypothetical protein